MAKYTIDHICGHSREIQLYGPGRERTRKLEWMAGQDCPQCWGAKQREIEAAKPIAMAIRCNGLDEDEHGDILAEVVLTGGTQPRKEEIKSLGYYWGEVRGGVLDMLSTRRAPMAWIKRVPIIELAKGHATALRLQADAKALGATIVAQVNPLDMEMARRRVADKCEQDARIAAIPKPIRPPCHPLEAHPEGTWNKKYYGIGKSGCRYYVSGIEYVLSAEEYHQCAAYRKAMEDYRAKVELAKAGKEAKINQIANLTFLEFEDNIEISDDKPSEYFAMVQKRFGESEIKEMLAQHAIPENFYQLEYDDFLQERRKLMTGIIKKAFNKI